MKHLRLGLLGLIALMLAGCAGGLPQLAQPAIRNPVGLKQLAVLESAYGVALSGALAYRNRPRCTVTHLESPTNLCARRSIVVKLIRADQIAEIALDNAQIFIANNPTLDASSVLQVATRAIAAFTAIQSGGS